MNPRSILLLSMVVVVAAVAALNWPAFTAPTRIDLLFAKVDFPLGLLMLGVLACFVLALAVLLAMSHGRALVETRRHNKEVERLRALAEQAEASRLEGLRAALLEEFGRLDARLVQLHEANRQALHEDVNSIAAMIGELDERLAQGTSV
ncbi:MAG TPA: LapA family protein, partial [Burkholderiaceae bacterium]|nr:LapA family protein [Burkholderiaceae bacterium]